MLFKRKASLSWWRFAGGMVFALLPLAFILFVLTREDDFLDSAPVLFLVAAAVAYAALRWHQMRKQFNGDADAAAAAIRQNPFGLAFGSPRTFIVWLLVTSLIVIASVFAWALWHELQ
ncbi:hypothetical protein [Pseudoxanthomonas sp.]|jgi:CDP-diglyceride synthetase|uniref:hypothetical protein n=1 Tax=Pseudoxanthomonas sp. TaxID=1871049 RepID=UPI002E134DF5|nr:hypothetical protein [Pseudoxanthomonas sp.]